MSEINLSKKIGNATKWSSITEVIAKLVNPVTSMILARLLTPEMFGVVATVNVIISFTDMFTDAGFQKYLIQHEFKDKDDFESSTSVAFWTNLAISLILWGGIILFRDSLSRLVGNPGKGFVIAVACSVLPMTSFSSIQMALYKRKFDFKSLFYARIGGILTPLVVTIPLAIVTRNYWALILGAIAKEFVNAIILTALSDWKPKFEYKVSKLREIFSFSMWTLLEQISIWLTIYCGTFIVGLYLTEYYVGLYKTSMTTVNNIINLVATAVTPILFSTLSRNQNDLVSFHKYYFSFLKMVGLLVIPMSAGIFLYRDFVTMVLLGRQWTEATMFVGLWGLTSSLGILLNNFSSECYRALGKPKISMLIQVIHLCFLIPVLIWASKTDFTILYWSRTLIRFQMYITQIIFMYIVVKVSFMDILKNVSSSIMATVIMSIGVLFLRKISTSYVWDFVSIIICILIYVIALLLFKDTRAIILDLLNKVITKIKKYK